MFICAERATAGSSTGRFLSIGAEFFYVYEGDGNIVRSVDIMRGWGYNLLIVMKLGSRARLSTPTVQRTIQYLSLVTSTPTATAATTTMRRSGCITSRAVTTMLVLVGLSMGMTIFIQTVVFWGKI